MGGFRERSRHAVAVEVDVERELVVEQSGGQGPLDLGVAEPLQHREPARPMGRFLIALNLLGDLHLAVAGARRARVGRRLEADVDDEVQGFPGHLGRGQVGARVNDRRLRLGLSSREDPAQRHHRRRGESDRVPERAKPHSTEEFNRSEVTCPTLWPDNRSGRDGMRSAPETTRRSDSTQTRSTTPPSSCSA